MSTSITDNHMTWKDRFSAVDRARTGTINLDQFKTLTSMLGFRLSDEALVEVTHTFSADGGCMTASDFVIVMDKVASHQYERDRLEESIRAVLPGPRNTVTLSSLRQVVNLDNEEWTMLTGAIPALSTDEGMALTDFAKLIVP